MPELPDVETMRRYLEANALHQEIEDVEVRAPRLVPSPQMPQENAVEDLKERLVGRCLASTWRYGKWLFVDLNGAGDGCEDTLVLHFGMTGGMKAFEAMEEDPPYDRVLFHFANGRHLAYCAMRKLGQVDVIDDAEQFIDRKGLGPDALDPGVDLPAFKEIVEGRRTMAKAVLMDQGTIAGIGNVYADEILFQAGVHPRTKIGKLDEETVEELFHEMKDVLQTAVACQAQPEAFPDTFLAPHRHEGGQCPACGAGLERVKVSSRSAYFCPNCQQKRS